QRIRVQAEVAAADLLLGDQVRIFGALLSLAADNGPAGSAPSGQLTLADAAAGLFVRNADVGAGAGATTPQDYQLAVTELAASLAFDSEGFTLAWQAGTLALPPEFFAATGGGAPTVSLDGADATQALQLTFHQGQASLALHGALVFRNFSLVLPGQSAAAGGVAIELAFAKLILDGLALPSLAELDGTLQGPLPDGKTLVVALDDFSWQLGSLPSGRISLAGDIDAIELGGGFELAILASDPQGQGRAPGLEFRPVVAHLHCLLEGGLRVTVPADLVSAEDTTGPPQVSLAGYGALVFATDPGVLPQFHVHALQLGAENLRFGGTNGLRVRQAQATLTGIGALLDAASTETLALDFSGEVEAIAGADTILFGLESARFVIPRAALPQFSFKSLTLGASTPLLGGMLRLTRAVLRFIDEGRPLLPAAGQAALLAPDNLELILSAELASPTGDGALIGGVEDTRCSLNADGWPVISLDGFSVGIDDLDVGVARLSGALALRGLAGEHPPRLVGKLG
ncbi:MAG TPA: hypothetical protein VLM87_14545, partial [Rubrivivax sp.]|nr:hypothetical protein [Rubrivivax sp.]